MDTATVLQRRTDVWRRWPLLGVALALTAASAAQEPPAGGDQADTVRRIEALEEELSTLKKQVKEGVEADKEAAKVNPKVEVGTRGLSVSSADGQHQLQLRLRLAMDYGGVFLDDGLEAVFDNENNGVDFRYARLILQGFVFNNWKYQIETDFAGDTGAGSPTFKDVFLEYDNIPYGGGRKMALRFGHFKEPFSLEDQNSTPDLTFLEKPLLDVFVPSRNVGLMASDAVIGQPSKERMTWALGVFKETDENPGILDNAVSRGYQTTLRLTGVPWYDKAGRRLMHLGFGYSHRKIGEVLDYRVRAESRLVLQRWVNPDLLLVADEDLPASVVRLNSADPDTADLFNVELAGVIGPWWWQAEYLHSLVHTELEGTLGFHGYYVESGYFLTGEKRVYRHDRGTFVPPTPKKNFNPFGESKGWGAWEVAGRYSVVDMSDGPVEGGKHTAYTLGLNWYANQNIRWTLNVIHNDIDNDFYDGDFQVVQSRVQVSF